MNGRKGSRSWRDIVIGVIIGFALFALVIAALGLLSGISGAFGSLPGLQSDCIGVITIQGEITTQSQSPGLFGSGTVGSDEIRELVKEAGDRSDVKGVVFVVNSPGGGVVASHEIYDEIKNLRKPKVAFFRELAASGGYYIAMGTDYIVSDPDAITGSIGVIAVFEDLSGLFEKLGLNFTVVKSGKYKDIGGPFRPPTEDEKAILQSVVAEIFGEFRQVVEEGRGDRLDKEKFEEILDARFMTGRQALQVGLVDEVGNRRRALQKAADLAGMQYSGDEPPTCVIERKRGFFEEIFGSSLQAFGQGIGQGLAPTTRGLRVNT